MKNISVLRAAAVLLPVLAAFTLQGCKGTGDAYSEEQVKQMNAIAAGAKDPSKLSPEYVKQRDAATAQLRAANSATPPPPPAPPGPAKQ
ncbi:MAG: hypothetical protein V4671_25600 [Armatimonadota bacterium]